MSLTLYKKKRNFSETPEPVSANIKKEDKLIFVVQRHKASRLHYDFRLEMNRVLKSWAIPKGPSMNPKDRRLAMMVEDHPIDYATFKGVIREGNYGAGIVEIWDHGTYTLSPENKGTGLQAIKNGALKVILKGRKLKGQFALIRFKNAGDNSWLLIKDRDKFAVDDDYNSEELTPKTSPINKALAKEKA
ncbi:MAG: DNA polymerase ligase N-terminal domain-containing protein [Ilyomonas sp.]